MNHKKIFLLSLCILALSCKKITNTRLVDAPKTATISYKIDDDSGKGIPEVEVSVYLAELSTESTAPNDHILVASAKTNQNGTAVFPSLLAGTYLMTAAPPAVNKIKYNMREYVQLVGGLDRQKVVKATEFTGVLNILVRNDILAPMENIGVAAIPYTEGGINPKNVQELLNKAMITGQSNKNGIAILNIPSNMEYLLILYTLNKDRFRFTNEIFYMKKGITRHTFFYF